MTLLIVFAYLIVGAATALWTWRVLGSGLGHTERDGARTAEAFFLWPVALVRIYPRQVTAFMEHLWPLFVEELKRELADEARTAEAPLTT